ncbi:ParB/RepB/Spo0J family partition protein [Patescibacteria group bacterium]|nr:ParB/RepB/Spo0J family partition protein [Patescibacteria group bacterium]
MNVVAINTEKQRREDQKFLDSLKPGMVVEIPIRLIKRNSEQPRKEFKLSELQKKANSMKDAGDVEIPINVTVRDGFVLIIDGECRFRGAKINNFTKISCLIKPQMEDKEVYKRSFIANTQRTDMSLMEIAIGFEQLMKDYNLNQSEVAEVSGFSQGFVSNTLKLLRLKESLRKKVITEELDNGIALMIAAFKENHQDMMYDLWLEVRKDKAEELGKKAETIKLHPNFLNRIFTAAAEKHGIKRRSRRGGQKRQLSSTEQTMRAVIRICKSLGTEIKFIENETAESLHSQKTTFTELMTTMEEALKSLKAQTERIQEMDGWKPEDKD